MKKVPDYWWDFEGDDIIVESDDDRFPVVGKFPINGNEQGSAVPAIASAEALIVELKSGRANPKKLSKSLP